jgi:hypothetical protein
MAGLQSLDELQQRSRWQHERLLREAAVDRLAARATLSGRDRNQPALTYRAIASRAQRTLTAFQRGLSAAILRSTTRKSHVTTHPEQT